VRACFELFWTFEVWKQVVIEIIVYFTYSQNKGGGGGEENLLKHVTIPYIIDIRSTSLA
jgi:hypothetical protein